MKRYHINVFWSDEDAAWIADVPDLKTCSAFGDTPERALAEVRKAMAAWLAVARAEGHPIPTPAFRPAIYATRPRRAAAHSLPARRAARPKLAMRRG